MHDKPFTTIIKISITTKTIAIDNYEPLKIRVIAPLYPSSVCESFLNCMEFCYIEIHSKMWYGLTDICHLSSIHQFLIFAFNIRSKIKWYKRNLDSESCLSKLISILKSIWFYDVITVNEAWRDQ